MRLATYLERNKTLRLERSHLVERTYVKNPKDAPAGVSLKQGPRGGYYYDDAGSGNEEPQQEDIDTFVAEYAEFHDNTLQTIQAAFSERKVYGRVKDKQSIAGKLERKPDQYKQLSDLRDVSGLRVESRSVGDVYADVERLKEAFNVVQEKDYIENPNNGYRSVHLIIEQDGRYSEIQVRTESMTKVADYAHDTIYKPSAQLGADTVQRIQDHMDELQSYVEGYWEYVYRVGLGEEAEAPDCPEIVAELIGCLEV